MLDYIGPLMPVMPPSRALRVYVPSRRWTDRRLNWRDHDLGRFPSVARSLERAKHEVYEIADGANDDNDRRFGQSTASHVDDEGDQADQHQCGRAFVLWIQVAPRPARRVWLVGILCRWRVAHAESWCRWVSHCIGAAIGSLRPAVGSDEVFREGWARVLAGCFTLGFDQHAVRVAVVVELADDAHGLPALNDSAPISEAP